MAERSHLSIGEVLSLLREEFPDVTISKIRFLESQGLVDPERTPSGYRKFYEHDVDRLRWILRQQREHFLPLKVIRGRLTEQEETGGEAEGTLEPVGPEGNEGPAGEDTEAALGARSAPAAVARRSAPPVTTAVRGNRGSESWGSDEPSPRPRPAPPTPSLFAGLHSAPAPAALAVPAAAPAPVPVPEAGPIEDDTYTAEELAAAVGAETALVHELKQYGLIAAHAVVAGTAYYDHGALAVTRAAAEFARHGVEARHLRMWRNAADREADLFQQVVLPLLRQRNPQARRQAAEALAELSASGAALRAALVERAVREIR